MEPRDILWLFLFQWYLQSLCQQHTEVSYLHFCLSIIFDPMLTKANGKLSVGFSGVWLSQCLCISELFNLHSANNPQAAQTSLFPWENVPSPSCDSQDLGRGQPGAGRLGGYRGRCACLASHFFRVSGSYLCYSTLQCVQSQTRKQEHIKTMHVAASTQ